MSPYLTRWLLLKVVVTVVAGKYVHVPLEMTFTEAQTFCRTNYTDLAPVNSEHDHRLIQQMDPPDWLLWIGLINTTNSSTGWMWSGGGEVSTFFWRTGEPSNYLGVEDNGGIQRYYGFHWNDLRGSSKYASLCYKVHAVRKRMTWDDALQYCRKNHNDLASVASETEMMLIEKELGKELSSNNVWIGLQFMDANWQWMDGQPFNFESWGPLEKPTCPDITFACGALRVRGPTQRVGSDILMNVTFVEGWNALDCKKKLHFLCY